MLVTQRGDCQLIPRSLSLPIATKSHFIIPNPFQTPHSAPHFPHHCFSLSLVSLVQVVKKMLINGLASDGARFYLSSFMQLELFFSPKVAISQLKYLQVCLSFSSGLPSIPTAQTCISVPSTGCFRLSQLPLQVPPPAPSTTCTSEQRTALTVPVACPVMQGSLCPPSLEVSHPFPLMEWKEDVTRSSSM